VQSAGLQEAFFSSTSVRQDQDVLLKLLQSCKQLHADVAQHCAGQMTAVLRSQFVEHTAAFACWLKRHARILQALEVQLPGKSDDDDSEAHAALEAAVQALAGAMFDQQQHLQGLQRFTLKSNFWAPEILLQLPISLKMLDLSGTSAIEAQMAYALAPIDRLQQLTDLRIGRVHPSQLSTVKLPPLLQHLDMTVELDSQPKALANLAGWLRRHGRDVRSLGLSSFSAFRMLGPDHQEMELELWEEAIKLVAKGLITAGAPPPPAAAAGYQLQASALTTNTRRHMTATAQLSTGAAACSSSLNMQMLHCCPSEGHSTVVPLPALLLQQLPAATLTQLVCGVEFNKPEHLASLCRLTALRSLELLPQLSVCVGNIQPSNHSRDMLSPMSALQQLTALKFDYVSAQQLAHLQLPQLQRLIVCIRRHARGRLEEEEE
jgi:hypothetical protein